MSVESFENCTLRLSVIPVTEFLYIGLMDNIIQLNGHRKKQLEIVSPDTHMCPTPSLGYNLQLIITVYLPYIRI